MALPYLDNPATLDDPTVQELDGLVAKLNTFLSREHNQQGGHTNITAQSVVVDGPVTVRDERQAPASFQRTVALGTQIAITPTPGGTTPWLTILYDKVEDVRLGQVSGGIYGGPGLRLGPAFAAGGPSPQPWDVVATSVSTGPALLFGDPVRHDRPLALLFNVAANHYEVRPNAVALDVWLGTNTGPTNQFARAYLSDNVYQRGRPLGMGDWQAVPFNAANFTASGGATWTVIAAAVAVQRFALTGQTMHYNIIVQNTTVGAVAPANLLIALPTGYTVAAPFISPLLTNASGGPQEIGYAAGGAGGTAISLVRLNSATWTLGAGTNAYVNITFEVIG
jgi:hypothetical protein